VTEASSSLPLSHLPAHEKARRSSSFGGVADDYERHRPGPPMAAVEWLVPEPVAQVVDLGAGTGALTRLLLERADHVVAVEPDDRMRSVLAEEVPGAQALPGRGESIPVDDATTQAVFASSSWHWMDPVPTLREVARVLVAGGVLGVLWSGPDPEDPLLVQARSLFAGNRTGGPGESSDPGAELPRELAELVAVDANRPSSTLEIPAGLPFGPPERKVFSWPVALDADGLIGLLGTFSTVIMLPDDARQNLFDQTRRIMRDVLGLEGDATIDVNFRAEVWRSAYTG
jgi:SAM-dependent methyltransferase